MWSRYNIEMSEADRIKEVIGWLKIVFAVLVAVEVSLIAWLAQNYQTADSVLVVLAVAAVVAATIGIIVVNLAAFRRMAELRDI